MATYQQLNANITKEAAPAAFSEKMHHIETSSLKTSCAIAHIRRATQGVVALRNTQPFSQTINDRSFVFAHNGDLHNIKNEIAISGDLLPKGETDSEYAFYLLMAEYSGLWKNNVPSLTERLTIIQNKLAQFATLGPANILFSDGDYLYAFANKRMQKNGLISAPGLYYLPRECRCDTDAIEHIGVNIKCKANKVLLFASVPLTNEEWRPFNENQLIVAKKGNIIFSHIEVN
jgi:glutamine amidotransferase